MRRPHTGTPSHAARRRATAAAVAAAATIALAALLIPTLVPRRAAAKGQAAKGAAPAAATGAVAGRVTMSDGKPAANVGVALTPAEQTADRKDAGRASTDAEVENIDLTLVRGGVITGRVTNAEGKPVVGERVTIVEADQPARPGPPAWVVSPFEFETDDRGVYRVYGVPAGRYLVSVGQDRDAGTIRVGPTGAQYSRTFHPNATEAAQAKIVEVTAGGEAQNVDIALAEAPKSYQATGKIIDDAGNAVAGVGYGHGAVRADAKTVGAFGSDGSVTTPEGEFTVRNLMPGRYAVFAISDFGSAPMEMYSDATPFEVTDADVSGLVVRVHRGASVSGTVSVEGTTDRAVLSRITQLNLNAQVRPAPGAATDQISAPTFASGRVNADGTFRFAGLRPGKVVINLFNFGAGTRGFSLLGVQRNGADASGGIDVAAGENVTGVRVRIGYGTGVLRGQIELREGGQPAALPAGARLSASLRRVVAGGSTANPPSAADSSEVDSRGRFVIEGLMGGDYELVVGVFMPGQPGAAPARRFAPLRQNVTVPDGGETTVTVVYDLSRPQEPTP
ncbi:MAG: carboxypeptidase-like regulatory domain-containing protein [Acidobacteria bacterium]|nr:carboxypeptidase-like regulatory domain-containing protein [Acidobacteriota bacterium]